MAGQGQTSTVLGWPFLEASKGFFPSSDMYVIIMPSGWGICYMLYDNDAICYRQQPYKRYPEENEAQRHEVTCSHS